MTDIWVLSCSWIIEYWIIKSYSTINQSINELPNNVLATIVDAPPKILNIKLPSSARQVSFCRVKWLSTSPRGIALHSICLDLSISTLVSLFCYCSEDSDCNNFWEYSSKFFFHIKLFEAALFDRDHGRLRISRLGSWISNGNVSFGDIYGIHHMQNSAGDFALTWRGW